MRKRVIIFLILLGLLLGLGITTFQYAKGFSYLSSDPKACVNCHIMNPQYDSWQKASHHAVATCVDCHLPHDFVGKYLSKAENGYHHSKAFTLQNFKEPIQITDKNRQILEQNCRHCHNNLLGEVLHSEIIQKERISCIHCHRSVGHGETVGLGGPLKQEEFKERA